MDSKKYASALKNAEYKSHVWLACGAVLLIANLMLAMAVISADSNEKTIIVPAGFNTPFTVEGNKVSPEYIEQMGPSSRCSTRCATPSRAASKTCSNHRS